MTSSSLSDHEYILNNVLNEVYEKVKGDRAHYGDNHKVLGLKGQFADIWRKVGPLKRALWEGHKLTREQPREICMDLIGHCLLTIAMLDREQAGELEYGPDVIANDSMRCQACFSAGPGEVEQRCILAFGHTNPHFTESGRSFG